MTGKQTLTEEQRQQKREAGRKGGQARVKKGFGTLSQEQLIEVSRKGGKNRGQTKQTPKA